MFTDVSVVVEEDRGEISPAESILTTGRMSGRSPSQVSQLLVWELIR